MPTTCPNCGRGTSRGERFCDGCGAFLGWGTGEAPESQLLPQQGAPVREDQRAGVQLQIKSNAISVAPGNAESTNFTVKNLGTQVEQFRLFVTGPAWITVEPTAMSVYPGQESSGALQAAPPRAPSSLAGVTPYQLTVRSAVHANVSASTAGGVDVAPYADLAAELMPTSSRGRGLTNHRINLDNRGNAPLRVALKATDVADGLRVGVPAAADVPPGRVIQVPVGVQGTRRWFGRPEPKTFAVIAEAPKPLAPTRLPGTRVVDALFPRWVPTAAAGLVVAVVAGVALIPKLAAHSTSTTSASAPPSSFTATAPPTSPSSAPSSASTSPSSASTSPSAATTTPPPPPPPPVVDLISAAPNANWSSAVTSIPSSQQTPQVQPNLTGCQTAAESATSGAVLSLTQVDLQDHTVAARALETDPPSDQTGTITGTYTFAATTTGDVFRAEVGFCWNAPSGAQMVYTVIAGQQQQSGLLNTATKKLSSVQINLQPGTTQITLEVQYETSSAAYADVVWWDPRIEAQSAPPPSPRPTFTGNPAAAAFASPSPTA